ncbi:unnamed protein product, partial [Brassica oleracea]
VDFHEKDWSFLKSMETEQTQKVKKIVKAGEVTESSRVLVSFSSEAFVDRLVESSPSQLLLIVHDSLFMLACVKEKYDKMSCFSIFFQLCLLVWTRCSRHCLNVVPQVTMF